MIPIRATFEYTGGQKLEINSLDYVEQVEVKAKTVHGFIHEFFINGESGFMESVFIGDDGLVYRANAEFLTVDMKDYNTVRNIKCQK